MHLLHNPLSTLAGMRQSYDMFRGCVPVEKREPETFPRKQRGLIRFPAKSHCEVAQFSPDGQYLVTGSFDGFLEVGLCRVCATIVPVI